MQDAQQDVEENENLLLSASSSEEMSSLSQSREIIVENPNGTYCHAVLAKAQIEEEKMSQAGHQVYPRNRMLYVVDDDEIALYSGFYDLPNTIDEFLDLYVRHQRYFTIFLVVFLLIEVGLEVLAFLHGDETAEQVMRTYRSSDVETFKTLFFGSLIAEVVYMVVYYSTGFTAIAKRSVRFYSWFATISLFGLLFKLILAYTGRFDIAIFLLRFAGFVYSRFVNQLLVSLLLLPR